MVLYCYKTTTDIISDFIFTLSCNVYTNFVKDTYFAQVLPSCLFYYKKENNRIIF